MILDTNKLVLDIKVTDRYRKWFSTLGNLDAVKASCVMLGDSDIEYTLAPNINKSRILNAPFAPEGIKHKLIYNGIGKNLNGIIKCFARRVITDGTVQGLYNYNVDETWTNGNTPPKLSNGKDFDTLVFNDTKMGYILFFETVLDFYIEQTTGLRQRLKEDYTITIDWDGTSVKPNDWDFLIDNTNGSMLIAKADTTALPIGATARGTITITGDFSKKTKIVKFNF